MQHARVLTLFAGLVLALSVFAPSKAAAAASTAGPPIIVARDLIRPKQPVPDDPLAGLSDDSGGHGKGGNGGSGHAACGVKAKAANDRDIGDLRAALAFVKHGVKSLSCPPRAAPTEVRLRISIDGTGKITAAEPVAGENRIAGAMVKRLTGKSIGPRADGATVGIVVLTFATGRP